MSLRCRRPNHLFKILLILSREEKPGLLKSKARSLCLVRKKNLSLKKCLFSSSHIELYFIHFFPPEELSASASCQTPGSWSSSKALGCPIKQLYYRIANNYNLLTVWYMLCATCFPRIILFLQQLCEVGCFRWGRCISARLNHMPKVT